MLDLLNLTQDLMTFKTVASNTDEILRCFKYIEKIFDDTNYKTDLIENNGHYSMIISNADTNEFDIVFNGHIDIVPADDEMFSPKIKEGFLYGRGSIDMKAQVACIIYTLKNYTGTKKLCAILTSDEEIGGENGTPFCIEVLNLKAKVAIVPDGGENFTLVTSCRGLLQLEIEARGLSAHASELELGRNAILMCYDLFVELGEILNSTAKDHTINLSSISTSNTAFNKVPDQAKMRLDIRYDPTCDIQKALQFLGSKANISFKISSSCLPMSVDPENAVIQKFIHSAENITGKPIEKIACFGATDGRYFTEKEIPVIMMNPNGFDIHGDNERLEIQSLYTLSKIFESFVLNFDK